MAPSPELRPQPKLLSGAQVLEVTVLVFGTAILLGGINGFAPSLIGGAVIWCIIIALVASVNAVRRSNWSKAQRKA